MIGSAKEAREILDRCSVCKGKYTHYCSNGACLQADSYLAALQGPEVKALVETIKRAIRECQTFPETACIFCDGKKHLEDCEVRSWKEVLAQYREAIK